MGKTPFNATSKSAMRDLAATLEAENRTLRRRLAQVAAENLSQESTIATLRARIERCPICERLRRAEARAQIDPLGPGMIPAARGRTGV
jgi:hypothetical protein